MLFLNLKSFCNRMRRVFLRVPQTTANCWLKRAAARTKSQVLSKSIITTNNFLNIKITWEDPEYSAHDFRLRFLINCYLGPKMTHPRNYGVIDVWGNKGTKLASLETKVKHQLFLQSASEMFSSLIKYIIATSVPRQKKKTWIKQQRP